MGEDPSVPILILIPKNINTVFSNQPLWTEFAGYIMNYAVGDRALKRMPERRLNLIDGSITSNLNIFNSTEWIDMIKHKLASVIGDI